MTLMPPISVHPSTIDRKIRPLSAAGLLGLFLILFGAQAGAAEARFITQGRAKTTIPDLLPCPSGQDTRISAVGTIRSKDGKLWTVPADTAFVKGPKASDLYNPCNGVMPAGLESIDTSNVPITEVDKDGEVITGYIFADNYFELYINGKLVAVDAVPFTPFNSAIVRFKAKRPITYAVKLVDWEDNLGLGTEKSVNGSGTHHAGDGGFIARFSDGTVTDSSWKAQSFYIAPLNNPSDVIERGNVHDTSQLGRYYPMAPNEAACGERCYAVHYTIPPHWASPKFNDKNWPKASEFTEEEVGVNYLTAYTAFSDAFSGARFIWSNNLVFDNLVLVRKVAP